MTYCAIEFILRDQTIINKALNNILYILQSCNCVLPCFYHDASSNSLVLVWRYKKNKNELAWDVCHHIPHMLFNEKSRDMVDFYNKYHTEPVVFSSERCSHILRFANPHAFTYLGDVSLELSELSVLLECDFDQKMFISDVKCLQNRTLKMIESINEIGKLDFSILYLLYKRVEAMAITTNTSEAVQTHLRYLNNIMLMK